MFVVSRYCTMLSMFISNGEFMNVWKQSRHFKLTANKIKININQKRSDKVSEPQFLSQIIHIDSDGSKSPWWLSPSLLLLLLLLLLSLLLLLLLPRLRLLLFLLLRSLLLFCCCWYGCCCRCRCCCCRCCCWCW